MKIAIFHTVMGPGCLLGLIQLVLLCKLASSSFLCDPRVTPNITSKTPHLPEINSSYVAYMEVWETDSQRIGFRQEYVDQDNNIAAVRVYGQYDPGDVYTHITDYNTDQVFTIAQTAQGVMCRVTDINGLDLFTLPYHMVNNKKHLVSTPALFNLGSGFALSYLGPDQVRGKAANHWQSCFKDNVTGVTTMTDIYFTASGWSTANSDDPSPLQTKITQLIPSPTEQDFQESVQMDFVFFQNSIIDRSIFQLPSEMYCEGRKSNKPFPNIPDHFQFQSEFIALPHHEVSIFNVWYDMEPKLVRIDSKPLLGDDPALKFSPRSTIRDYNTGIQYIIDQQTGVCEVTPVSPDSSKSFLVDFQLVGMIEATTFNMFNINKGNFTYWGQTNVRGINTDTWVGKSAELEDEKNTTFIMKWHFSTDEWSSNQYGEYRKATPMQLTIDSLENDLQYIYNIYDFNPNTPDLNIFDVTRCYHDADYHLVHFCLELKGDQKVVSNLTTVFENQLVNTLTNVMGVSVIRISNVKTDFSSSGACVTFTLFDWLNVTGNTQGNVGNHTAINDSIAALNKFMDMRTEILFNDTDKNVSATYIGVPWSLRDEIHYGNGSVKVLLDPPLITSTGSTIDVHETSGQTLSSPSVTTTRLPVKTATLQSATSLPSSSSTTAITQVAKECVTINEEHSQEKLWSTGRIAGLSVGLCLGSALIGAVLARFTYKCRLNVKLKRSEIFTRGGLDYSMM